MHLGENNVPSPNFTMETIMIEKIYTLHDGVCYLVTPKYKIGSRGLYDDMVISMSHSLDPQDIPESIKIIVTSKDNRFGPILNRWLEGNVFEATIAYKKENEMALHLKQINYKFLPKTSNCKEESVYDCVAKYVASSIMEYQLPSPITCIPAVYQTYVKMALNVSFELCEKTKENYHMLLKFADLLNSAIKTCPTSCTRSEYVGRQSPFEYPSPGLALFWRFESTNVQVYQEYLMMRLE